MTDKIKKLHLEFLSEIQDVKTVSELESIRLKYLGRKSDFSNLLGQLKTLSVQEKKEVGIIANDTKKDITQFIDNRLSEIESIIDDSFSIDVTLPGTKRQIGQLHPHTIVMREMNEIFKQMGFSIYTGPEIETDEYVFEKLNLPKNHPARSLQDTLVIDDPEVILRSHTSSVELRAMENEKLPIRIVVPGRAFRYENLNQTNHFAFYQYEGLAVGQNITLADLKGTLESFALSFFGPQTKIRLRSKFYPQVEPGCGLDIQCKFCSGNGCFVCKKRGWLEASGGGMVHPNALRSVGIDPDVYSGFAFGMGFDRIVMQKCGITDIRKLYDGTLI